MAALEWTVVTRVKRGRFFRPVANVPTGLGWREAVEVAGAIIRAYPELDVWYVPTQESEQFPEDRDNILMETGRRVPIRWDSAPQAAYAPVAVVDIEGVKEGELCTVVARFATVTEAEQFLADHDDQAKVERGGFSIDAPEEMMS